AAADHEIGRELLDGACRRRPAPYECENFAEKRPELETLLALKSFPPDRQIDGIDAAGVGRGLPEELRVRGPAIEAEQPLAGALVESALEAQHAVRVQPGERIAHAVGP